MYTLAASPVMASAGAASGEAYLTPCTGSCRLLICLLGDFRLLLAGNLIPVPNGGKVEKLFACLGRRPRQRVAREILLDAIWPGADPALAAQSLNSLIYTMRKTLAEGLDGAGPVIQADGFYRLNTEAGVCVDINRFDQLVNAGETAAAAGNPTDAAAIYDCALELYRGDLTADTDVGDLIERERLRARYLSILARLADYRYAAGDYAGALAHALRLLASDPCREDAHRLVMACHVRLGQRAQALRQFHLCEKILRAEFNTAPEKATLALYEQVRCAPDSL